MVVFRLCLVVLATSALVGCGGETSSTAIPASKPAVSSPGGGNTASGEGSTDSSVAKPELIE